MGGLTELETSNNAWLVEGPDVWGRKPSLRASDPEALIKEAEQVAERINSESNTAWQVNQICALCALDRQTAARLFGHLSQSLCVLMMEESDRQLAQSVLNRLIKGSAVSGLRFFTPQLLLDGPKDIRQEAYINLTSEWEVFDSMPENFPSAFEDLTQEEEEIKILSLRSEEVESIEIMSPWPHLVIRFKSGKVLLMNGKDEQYEPWTAGLTNFGKDADEWLVVACPGGGLAVWAPEGRESNENA